MDSKRDQLEKYHGVMKDVTVHNAVATRDHTVLHLNLTNTSVCEPYANELPLLYAHDMSMMVVSGVPATLAGAGLYDFLTTGACTDASYSKVSIKSPKTPRPFEINYDAKPVNIDVDLLVSIDGSLITLEVRPVENNNLPVFLSADTAYAILAATSTLHQNPFVMGLAYGIATKKAQWRTQPVINATFLLYQEAPEDEDDAHKGGYPFRAVLTDVNC